MIPKTISEKSVLFVLNLFFFGSAMMPQKGFSLVKEQFLGTMNANHLIAADIPLPITHFVKGNWRVSIKPTYFKIDTLINTTKDPGATRGGGNIWSGDDLTGWGGSAGYSYAFTNRWLAYGIFTGAKSSGKSKGRYGYSDKYPHINQDGSQEYVSASDLPDLAQIEGTNTFYQANFGVGFDLIKGEEDRKWSVPVLFGFFVQRYKSDMKQSPIFGTGSKYLDDQWYNITGEGTIFGVSGGIEAARNFGKYLQVVPYIIYPVSFSSPKLNSVRTRSWYSASLITGNANDTTRIYSEDTALTSGRVGQTDSQSFGHNTFPAFGLNMTYRPWGLTLSLGGLMTSFYSSELFKGLKMTKFSISYSFGKYEK